MNTANIEYLCRMVKDKVGLDLTPEKEYLWRSRLDPVARMHKFEDIDGLVEALRGGRNGTLSEAVIAAITTNETSFFRDTKPFEHFKTVVLPRLRETRPDGRTIRIWSAACSSGQEAYSLAMIWLAEQHKLPNWKLEILGTDVSGPILARAKAGIYSQFEVQRGLPAPHLIKHFSKEGETWQVKPEVREFARFRPFNLLDDPTALGRFDVIFCRNVLIYFDQPTKEGVLNRIGNVLWDDGFLYLGGVETVLGMNTRFTRLPNRQEAYGKVDSNGQPILLAS